MNTPHRCWAEVDLNALRENLAWIRHRVGPTTKILTVVKADAYGHGLKQIAALLMQSGTDIFGVANLAEARAVRSVGKGWPVLMLGALLPEEFEPAVRDKVRVTVSTLAEAHALSGVATRLRLKAVVHLKVDTGMGRLGVSVDGAVSLAAAVQALPGIELEGIYTHYASAEDDAAFSQEQSKRFRAVLDVLKAGGTNLSLVHANNSAALLHQPETNHGMVRPGLLVYGVVPEGRRTEASGLRRWLKPALTWKARVALVKEIPKGTSLSYGRTFIAPRRMRVATLTVGYGDGYLRSGSNRAEVLLHGKRCRVLGRITMDQMMVDVTRVDAAVASDEAVLIGRQGSHDITAGELAAWCGTIPWEALTAISHRVPRVYRGGQAA